SPTYIDTPSLHDALPISFGDLHVLRNVDLQLYNGENLVVLGRSGTGKSVLIKLISGLLKPDKGDITVLGELVNQLNEKELRDLRSEEHTSELQSRENLVC